MLLLQVLNSLLLLLFLLVLEKCPLIAPHIAHTYQRMKKGIKAWHATDAVSSRGKKG